MRRTRKQPGRKESPGGLETRKSMLWKLALVVVAITIAAVAPEGAIAGSDHVTCVSKGQHFNTKTATDGTFCEVDSETGGKSTAKATTGGSASADDFDFGNATASASNDGEATAQGQFTKGKAKATASGKNSVALAIGVDCHATASSKTAGNATAKCGTGSAEATASDAGTADAETFGGTTNCLVKASATGAGSMSTAECKKDGGFVIVTTTGDGVAMGDGITSPICTPNSGTATVKSSGGNCP
jgi:hypothetical protein